MLKKFLLGLTTGLMLATVAIAQNNPCATMEQHEQMKQLLPQIAQQELKLEQYIRNYLLTQSLLKTDPKNPNDTLHIPVVVHIVHNGGASFISDANVQTMIKDLNSVYLKLNADTAQVIAPFKRYIGKANIMFHLATKDPFGNPTKGITRKYSYTSNGGDDQSKFDQWAPSRYLNIWVVQAIGNNPAQGQTLAYATLPSGADAYPYTDGILVWYSAMNQGKTVEHEAGHYFNLYHTWGNGDITAQTCGDDEVADTPPTKGHFSTCPTYDTACLTTIKTIAKLKIDTNKTITDTFTNRGMDFKTRTRVKINSVVLYPGANTPIGAPFQIVLKKKNSATIVATYNDTVKAGSSATNYQQIAPVNFVIDNWDTTNGFEMLLTQNPGFRHDSLSSNIALEIQGALKLSNIGTNQLYNYFYKWDVTHYYFTLDDNNQNIVYDYPDTVNTQNIMDYSSCTNMFTHGQVSRMRAALNAPTALRSNLWDSLNLVVTGALAPTPDLAPIADYALSNNLPRYICANNLTTTQLTDYSWNDTIASRQWSASSGVTATTPNAASTGIRSSQPGWATVTLTVNSNAGSSTVSKQPVYFADPTPTPAVNYYQEFDNTAQNDKWPIFNPFENNFQWTLANTGYYDNSSYSFRTYDTRQYPNNRNGWAKGDIDEFYSPVMDLSTLAGTKHYLNFMYAGAYITNLTSLMKDSFTISYSTNCGSSWTRLTSIANTEISTVGTVTGAFTPSSSQDWKPKSILLPATLNTATNVMFRFSFAANPVNAGGSNTFAYNPGNNFYIDRINFKEFSLDVADVVLENANIALVPNPTSSNAYVYLNLGNKNQEVKMNVLDVTGKLVYSTTANLSGQKAKVEIPASALRTAGVYIVQITTAGQTKAERLIVK